VIGADIEVCAECASSYETCDDCDSLAQELYSVDSGNRVCERCADEDYHECSDCFTLVPVDTTYCDNCTDTYSTAHHAVHDSYYTPELRFHGDGPLFLGMEVEIKTPSRSYRDAVDTAVAHVRDLAYLKEDGSISCGFELVTHPMSYGYALERFPWQLLNRLRLLGCYTDDGVGIHVHVSRAGFSSPAHAYRWLKFVYRNEESVTTLARRSSTWAQFSPQQRSSALDYVKGGQAGYGRYQAINVCPEHLRAAGLRQFPAPPAGSSGVGVRGGVGRIHPRAVGGGYRAPARLGMDRLHHLGALAPGLLPAAGRNGGPRMCILTFVKPGISPDLDALCNGALANPHGHGYAIVTDDAIAIGRGMNTAAAISEFAQVRARFPDGAALFHSRLATHGPRTVENCHPFLVGGDERTVLAHNGILPDNVHPASGDQRSDTRIAAEDFLPTRPFGSLDSWAGRERLERWLGSDKMVLLTVDPTYKHSAYLFNEPYGHWDGGIYAWERQGRTPSAETLEAFLNGLEVPQWRRPTYAALAQPLLNQLNWDMSPVVTPDDQLGLDRNLDPACYHDDAFDLYAANQPLRARFPGLVAPAPDATVRPNLLEWVVRDPAAKRVIRNWEERATVMANAFLIVAPGRIPERRIQQIISSCEQAPEWPEISRIRATDEHVLNQRIYLWDPETECYENRIITAYTFKYPPRPYNVLVLQATVPQS
jgi:hypothetical protein